MPRSSRWEEVDKNFGIFDIQLLSWKYFYDYIQQQMLDYRQFIWRGQRCDNWLLEPTLDRKIKKFNKLTQIRKAQEHLENFKLAVRGRRGPNPTAVNDENEWWALGQHYGLSTPLLDWTTSPFVAAYFAFYKEGQDQTSRREIYGLFQHTIKRKSLEISRKSAEGIRPPIIEFVSPLLDENARLMSQGGLFTRSPTGVDIESWMKQNFQQETEYMYLIKITVPNKDRTICLKSLNRTNINHLSLFPDIYGASQFCNMDLEITNY